LSTLYAVFYTLLFVGILGAFLYACHKIGEALAKSESDDDNWPHGGATGGA